MDKNWVMAQFDTAYYRMPDLEDIVPTHRRWAEMEARKDFILFMVGDEERGRVLITAAAEPSSYSAKILLGELADFLHTHDLELYTIKCDKVRDASLFASIRALYPTKQRAAHTHTTRTSPTATLIQEVAIGTLFAGGIGLLALGAGWVFRGYLRHMGAGAEAHVYVLGGCFGLASLALACGAVWVLWVMVGDAFGTWRARTKSGNRSSDG